MQLRRRGPADPIVILAWNVLVAHPGVPRLAAPEHPARRSGDSGRQRVHRRNGPGLAERPWVEVITNPDNHGFAGGCNDGARGPRAEIVVFLNNDTVVPQSWLTNLLEPFSRPLVGATGPRSNAVSGIQLLTPVPYASPFLPEFERFADAWAAWFGGQSTEVRRLVGFCLAVRREAFEDVGGFDERFVGGNFEDDDLCCKLSSVGWTLRVAQGCFVHHDNHVSFQPEQRRFLGRCFTPTGSALPANGRVPGRVRREGQGVGVRKICFGVATAGSQRP